MLTALNVSDQGITSFSPYGKRGEYSEAIKEEMFRFKDHDDRNPVDLGTGERRWPLDPGSLVLHAMDCVFLAVRWPYAKERWWVPKFKGYIVSKTIDENRVNGKSTISVRCEDIRYALNKMRVQINHMVTTEAFTVTTGAGDASNPESSKLNAFDPLLRESLFADLQLPTSLTDAFAGLSLEETITTLITGRHLTGDEHDDAGFLERVFTFATEKGAPDIAGINVITDADGEETKIQIKGIGRFNNEPQIMRWPKDDGFSDADKDILEKWHSLCLFGVETKGALWTDTTLETHAAECRWDGRTAPHAMNLLMLMPSDGSGVKGLTDYVEDEGSAERDWQTRLSIIEDRLEKLDYQWTVLGTGDIVVEFPMYDLLPEQFGEWKDAFIFKKGGELKSINFEDDRPEVPSVIRATGKWGNNLYTPAVLGQGGGLMDSTRVTLYAPMIAARFGMTVETVSFPFVTDVCRLRQFAILAFQRKLAEANTLSFEAVARPILMTNRPVYIEARGRMGWIQGLSETFSNRTEHGNVSTSATLQYIRKLAPDGTFRLITGSQHMPLSYSGVGPSIEAPRGIFITETITGGVTTTCDEVVGMPPGIDSSFISSSESALAAQAVIEASIAETLENGECSQDDQKLEQNTRNLWYRLKSDSRSKLRLNLSLICTHNSGDEKHESIDPYDHDKDPSTAFDIAITRHDGSPAGASDYTAVGSLGVSLGLKWAGSTSLGEGSDVDTIIDKIISRADWHVAQQTPYIYGGDFSSSFFYGVDCSGLVWECYNYAGVTIPRTTSSGFQSHFAPPNTTEAPEGGVAFYTSRNGTVSHIVLIGRGGVIYSASGGNKSCTTLERAKERDARVKQWSSYQYRSGFLRFGTMFSDIAVNAGANVNHFSL